MMELSNWALISSALSLLACGGIVESDPELRTGASPRSASSSTPPDPQLDGSAQGSTEGESCDCQVDSVIRLNGPDGYLLYDVEGPTSSRCNSEFEQATDDPCLDFVFSACNSSAGCVYLAKTTTGTLLQFTDTSASSLRSISGARENIVTEARRGSLYGEFSFDDGETSRYSGSFELCRFEARQIDQECNAE